MYWGVTTESGGECGREHGARFRLCEKRDVARWVARPLSAGSSELALCRHHRVFRFGLRVAKGMLDVAQAKESRPACRTSADF